MFDRRELLTRRWTELPRCGQVHEDYFHSDARFIVVPAGRRSYKTEIGKRKLVLAALGCNHENGWYVAAAPVYHQAKRIFWQDLIDLTPSTFVYGISVSTLTIMLVNGARMSVVGMDKPERVEGSMLSGILLDEFANMKPDTWTHHVRPALSDPMLADRRPFAWFIGVPEGRNHYYDLALQARTDATGDWAYFTWPSADVIDPTEVATARNELDEKTFRQEYEGSFESFAGRVYYAFDDLVNLRDGLPYDKKRDLVFAFDFNVQPGVAGVGQEAAHEGGGTETHAIGEVWIPRDSNTPQVCRKLLDDWGSHQGRVLVYGDATGGARGTAAVSGSDWDLVRQILGRHYGNRLSMRVKQRNPPVRSRVNAVNSRLRSADGDVRFLIDRAKCPHLVRDLDGVQWKEGAASDEIDKTKAPELTHISDAWGYYVESVFPIRKEVFERIAL